MSGTIVLDSEQGVGSIATFTIPLKISSYSHYPQHSPPSKGFSLFNNSSNVQFCPNQPDDVATILQRPVIRPGPVSQQIINQQISTSDTNHVLPPYLGTGRNDKECESKVSQGERAEILVLVVEDK